MAGEASTNHDAYEFEHDLHWDQPASDFVSTFTVGTKCIIITRSESGEVKKKKLKKKKKRAAADDEPDQNSEEPDSDLDEESKAMFAMLGLPSGFSSTRSTRKKNNKRRKCNPALSEDPELPNASISNDNESATVEKRDEEYDGGVESAHPQFDNWDDYMRYYYPGWDPSMGYAMAYQPTAASADSDLAAAARSSTLESTGISVEEVDTEEQPLISNKSKKQRRRSRKNSNKKLDQAEANFGPDGEPVSPNQSELFTRHEFQGSHIIFGGEDGEPSVSTSKNAAEAREDVDDHLQGDEQWENEADNIPVDEINYKYWYQRYTLFSKFDEGIKLDREGWFSVTPEVIASHIAERAVSSLGPTALVWDGMCGPGGNTIQFATKLPLVIASDLDPKKIAMAKHNASIYGVDNKIDFIIGDYMCLAPRFRTDAVFLSPPWGGPEYSAKDSFDLHGMTPDGFELFKTTQQVSNNIMYFLPKNTEPAQIAELLQDGESCEVEQNYANGRLKTLTVYTGDLARSQVLDSEATTDVSQQQTAQPNVSDGIESTESMMQ